ncbi:peptidoglycan/LPS O-acetylase OafA/YrhL [Sphaerotilus hippei]|uniref:Peptidoglycan/LPS O-acetylase OafA/YrhL n=1 Tax=Sphaerotilus hippei TaxID=744406 RepID=A0A318HB44_9BURK|nr:acyltransferase family protein [Sphaerotilus hippei]PXW99512.1 peptidoglycan/LPS O-acetylase OafA/YrhL [Sphaerotilus hippei]
MNAAPVPRASPAGGPPVGVIDLVRVLATQLIVWHHLAFYGPMSDVVHREWPLPIGALYDHGRLAVQVFLVLGGYLAARSLAGRLTLPPGRAVPALPLPRLLWQRYVRLVQPLGVALLLAIAAAALARQLMDHEATPAAPTWEQWAAHLLLLHDVLDYDGLSAGVWYVAIDFQLQALLIAWAWLCRLAMPGASRWPQRLFFVGSALLTVVSLLCFNRQPELDVWAPYFYGSFGLGVMVQGLTRRGRPWGALAALLLLVGLVLEVEWRLRILVAGGTAMALVVCVASRRCADWQPAAWLQGLARVSYAQFLLHYPLALVVNALVFRLWPEQVVANAAGMLAIWLLSLPAAMLFHALVEAPTATRHWQALGRLLMRLLRLPRPSVG